MDLFGGRRVTLSVEGSWIRLLGTRQREVEYWAEIPFDGAILPNGAISDPSAVGDIIGATFRLRSLPRNSVVAAIPGVNAVSRILTIPKVSGSLEQVVDREARRVLPSTNQNTNLYWQAIDPRGKAQQRVYVLAAPREPITAMMDALKRADIRPRAIDLKPLALYRAVNRKDAIIGNLESTTLDVVIVVDFLPVIVRTSYLGDLGTAPEMLQGRLTDELSRTIRYYNDTNRQKPLEASVPVYLSGEDVEEPNLVSNIEALTGHPIEVAKPPLRYPEDFPVTRYLANVGLALKQ